MNAKRQTAEEELALLLKRVCEQLLVDAQRADSDGAAAGPDLVRWHDLYNEAAALVTRRVRRVVD